MSSSGRVIVVGAGGQLGRALVARLGDRAIPVTRSEWDLRDLSGVTRVFEGASADVVINAAAYTRVDDAESEPDNAFAVNAVATWILAREAAARGIRLIHISTDHVFGWDNARDFPWREDDLPAPMNVYGASKLAGEHAVRIASPAHLVVRTCGLFGPVPIPGRGNFVEAILARAEQGLPLNVVSDQTCAPTSMTDLAAVIESLIATDAAGLLHANSAGAVNWYDFAREIVQRSGLSASVTPVTSAEYGSPARRPRYSVLDTSRLMSRLGDSMRHWSDALDDYLCSRPG